MRRALLLISRVELGSLAFEVKLCCPKELPGDLDRLTFKAITDTMHVQVPCEQLGIIQLKHYS